MNNMTPKHLKHIPSWVSFQFNVREHFLIDSFWLRANKSSLHFNTHGVFPYYCPSDSMQAVQLFLHTMRDKEVQKLGFTF